MIQIKDYSFLRYTDDTHEQVSIGKRIVRENPDIYSKKLLSTIENILKRSEIEKSDLTYDQLLYKSIFDYWVWGFSADELVYYHLLFSDSEEKFKYISDRNRFNYYFHLNSKEDVHMLNNKWETYSLISEAYKRDVVCISDYNDRDAFNEFVAKHAEFCVKPSGGSCGKGVHKDSIYNYPDNNTLFEKIILEKESISTSEDNRYLILEELITQSEVLSEIHPCSVNGVRLTTLHINGEITFFTPWLKVGNNNAFVGTAAQGGFIAGIDSQSGIVCTPGISENGKSYSTHPLTGAMFEGTQIPNWKDLLILATELVHKLPMFGYIGWDFVPTKDRGWCVMEANYGGQMLGQLVYHKGLKREFENIIDWKLEKSFWWE